MCCRGWAGRCNIPNRLLIRCCGSQVSTCSTNLRHDLPMSLAYIRSLLITDPIIILATIVMGSVSLLVSLFESDGRVQHQISRIWSRMLLRVSGVKMRIEGLEKIDPRATYVFVANHRSFMDIPVLLAHSPLQFRFMAKKGLILIPFLGTHLQAAGHLAV